MRAVRAGWVGLQLLGAVVKKSFAAYGRGTLLTNQAAIPISVLSQFAGILAWGFGTCWWRFAIISIPNSYVGGSAGGYQKDDLQHGGVISGVSSGRLSPDYV